MAHIGRLIVVGLALTGCGGARVVQASQPVKGIVRYCASESAERFDVKRFNREHARQGLTARLRVVRDEQALDAAFKRRECDVLELDSYSVARYAAAGSLRDLTAHVRARRHEFVPATLLSGHYAKRDWALPLYIDVGLLFSRTYDRPKTLQELYRRSGFVYAGGPGSALAFLEAAYAAGGRPATMIIGMDLVVTRTARNLPAALAFIDARTSVAGERPGAAVGYLPTLARSYDDYERQNVVAGPFVMRALRHAVTLPVTPHLPAIARVVTVTVHAAVTGRMSVARALREGSRAIDQILANEAPGGEA